MSTTVQPVLTDRQGAVLTLTLNRPEKLNALTDGVLAGLRDGLAEARDDDGIRAVVITGAGRGFCAGQDLTVNADNPALDVEHHLATSYHPVITAIREIEMPVIAAVNGVAAGAGLSLALACDLRIAARSASFIQAFVRIGLVPDAGGTFFLPRLVGMARAMELAMLGDTVRADDAARIGLVNRVVDDAALTGEVADLAARLARGPRSVGLIKRVLNQSLQNDLAAQLRLEAETQAMAASTDDFREGVMAFIERRPAEFQGR